MYIRNHEGKFVKFEWKKYRSEKKGNLDRLNVLKDRQRELDGER